MTASYHPALPAASAQHRRPPAGVGFPAAPAGRHAPCGRALAVGIRCVARLVGDPDEQPAHRRGRAGLPAAAGRQSRRWAAAGRGCDRDAAASAQAGGTVPVPGLAGLAAVLSPLGRTHNGSHSWISLVACRCNRRSWPRWCCASAWPRCSPGADISSVIPAWSMWCSRSRSPRSRWVSSCFSRISAR